MNSLKKFYKFPFNSLNKKLCSHRVKGEQKCIADVCPDGRIAYAHSTFAPASATVFVDAVATKPKALVPLIPFLSHPAFPCPITLSALPLLPLQSASLAKL